MEGGDIMHTIQELADALKISYRSAWLKVKAGKVKCIRVGSKWRISDEEFARVLKEGC